MEFRTPWDPVPVPPATPADLPETIPPSKRRGRRPAAASPAASPSGWRYHHLTVSGPAEPLAGFAAAARGAGVVPWVLDLGRIEEDVFNLATAQPPARRSLTIAGCHILARQFRERAAMHQAKAAALVGRSRACPFDLHALLPVPEAMLRLGPTHPAALAWLSEHWGITDRLRQVAEPPGCTDRRHSGHPFGDIADVYVSISFRLRPPLAELSLLRSLFHPACHDRLLIDEPVQCTPCGRLRRP